MAPILHIPKVLLLLHCLVKPNPMPTARCVITLLLEDTDGQEEQIRFWKVTLIVKPSLFSSYGPATASWKWAFLMYLKHFTCYFQKWSVQYNILPLKDRYPSWLFSKLAATFFPPTHKINVFFISIFNILNLETGIPVVFIGFYWCSVSEISSLFLYLHSKHLEYLKRDFGLNLIKCEVSWLKTILTQATL